MRRPKWLHLRVVAAIHDEALHEFGGLAGIRAVGLLESAIDRARNRLEYEPRSTLFDLAAALCVGITRNHPFVDGNKRTALLATRAFLFLNGYALEPEEDDEVVTMLAVAEGSLNEPALAQWLRKNSTRAA